MEYNVKMIDFCKIYLGGVKGVSSIPNGISNRVCLVETIDSKYVIKEINPSRTKTEAHVKRIELSEQIGFLAKEKGISSIAAKKINGKFLHLLEGQYYVVYKFFEGHIKTPNEITMENCYSVGKELAKIHNMDISCDDHLSKCINSFSYGSVGLSHKVEWEDYMERVAKANPKWLTKFEEKLPGLHEMFYHSLVGFLSFIPSDIVVSHNDLHPENVMWKDDVPYVIDWEAAGLVDATFDCLHMSMRWATTSGKESRNIEQDKLYAFFKGYAKERSINIENIEISLYMVFYRRLNSLRYALINFIKYEDEMMRKRLGYQINYSLAILDTYLDQLNKIDEIKNYIAKLQPEETYKKSPSYELMPKMKMFVNNNNAMIDKYKEVRRKYAFVKDKVK